MSDAFRNEYDWVSNDSVWHESDIVKKINMRSWKLQKNSNVWSYLDIVKSRVVILGNPPSIVRM